MSVACVAFGHQQARSQALIMLLLGDKVSSPNFTAGINAGLSLTTLSQPESATARLSWSFGAFLEWRLSDNVFIGSDITFKNPGGAKTLTGLWDDVPEIDTVFSEKKESLQTSYVSLPVIIKYQFSSFRVFGGPQVSYLVAATDNISGTGPSGARIDADRSAFSKLNRWDAGFVVGLEALVTPSQGVYSLRLALRYYQGLVDVTKDPNVNTLNSGFYFTIGIPLGSPSDFDSEESEE